MGQVGSESIGFNMYSGTGGQLDFVRGASQSKGEQSFVALLSTAQTKNGLVSRINTALPMGAIVTTPRTDVQCVVTEYGVADLMDLSLSQSAEALIAIAHPAFRDQLRHDAKKAGLLH
jgi:4-hydroxybutyrate CoA-transferase